MSDRDIDAGQRWNDELSARLRETNFGIICLTPENITAPWLLFEAGALAKAVDSARVVPVLVGLRRADLTFPLAQFQAVEADRDGFLSLVTAVNRALKDGQLAPNVLGNIFEGLWPNFETKLKSLRDPPDQVSAGARRNDRELLEDVLESVRVIQRALGDGPPSSGLAPLERAGWEDHYIRGVNLANSRGGVGANIAALRSYNEAIALAPDDLPRNSMSRLYAYRAALFKRLNRLEEAENDLVLAGKWASFDQEIEDAMYNTACVKAMSGQRPEAIRILRELITKEPSWRNVVRQKPQYFSNLKDSAEFRKLIGR